MENKPVGVYEVMKVHALLNDPVCKELQKRIESLESENARLRSALEKIEMMKCEGFDCVLEAKVALSQGKGNENI